MANEGTPITPSIEVSSNPPQKKSYVPESQTGLHDYAYWCEYAEKHSKESERDLSKTFRRGRIWS